MLDSINGVRTVLEPLQDLWYWASANRWLLLCAVFIVAIALIRVLRNEHVKAYQNFDYQGPAQGRMDSAEDGDRIMSAFLAVSCVAGGKSRGWSRQIGTFNGGLRSAGAVGAYH